MEGSSQPGIRKIDETPADNRRGGDVRTLLSPKTIGSTSGFMGVATIPPGQGISEHYHPYSEEFIFLVRGTLVARLDGVEKEILARSGMMVPIDVRHKLINRSDEDAFIVFQLSPLAPRPDMGHVDTE